MDLVLGLPLRHRSELTNFLRQIYQPGHPAFRHYLTPSQFAAKYGPTEKDYQSVINFAKSHGLTVTRTHPNRALLDVNGTVGDIERALHVKMNYYQHPAENRTFYAPDAPPTIDLDTPLLAISGLHNYTLPHPCIHPTPVSGAPLPQDGSGPDESYLGGDFRAAYVPGVSLTGTGQSVGLFELDGFIPGDITNYEILAGQTNGPLVQSVLVDGFSGGTGFNGGDAEVCLDIEMAISMAPGLESVLVYEGDYSTDDILNRMATDDLANQLSSSWIFFVDAITEQIFQQFAAQGQSFFQASGDYGAYNGIVAQPCDDPNVTCVGGTYLTTSGPLGSWTGETVWDRGNGLGSGGGISAEYPIPFWQQGVSMTANGGSTSRRNLPDVAMVADGVWVQVTTHPGGYGGTSVSTPLWAAFTALVNQQAAANGQPPLGFANPALYAIGRGANYSNCFHDITVGNSIGSLNPTNFYAAAGYDLCTGWGTPNGSNLINALISPSEDLVITPALGLTFTGPVGGPFFPSVEKFSLTNAGTNVLNWAVSNSAPWLTVLPSGGALTPGGPGVTVMASPNGAASNILMSDLSGTLTFVNQQDGSAQYWPVALQSGNGGFETGDFRYWNFIGDTNACQAVNLEYSDFGGSDAFGDVPYSDFVYSGFWGAYLGENGSLGLLSQSLATAAGHYYLLSCWLSSLADEGATTPNEFQVQWNGTMLFDQTNMPAFAWTNLQYLVSATGSATTLQFGFRDDPAALALDDVTVQAVPAPIFQSVNASGGTVTLTWAALPGLSYQLQYTADLASSDWINLGPPTNAVTNIVTVSDIHPAVPRRFYRFLVLP